MEELSCKKRVRDDSDESEVDWPEVKRLKEDLLGGFEDSDPCTTTPADLDSFMKSFEEEISASPRLAPPAPVAESGESQPDLGYLFEASDDELGLPPSSTTPASEVASNEEQEPGRFFSGSAELGEIWRLDDQMPSYDTFDFGISGEENGYNNGCEYVALDGLFDYSDVDVGSTDGSEFLWRPETLPAQ